MVNNIATLVLTQNDIRLLTEALSEYKVNLVEFAQDDPKYETDLQTTIDLINRVHLARIEAQKDGHPRQQH